MAVLCPQLDLAEFRLLLASCEAPITEEEFCMLVDKYDINEDGAISDTELLAHVRGAENSSLLRMVHLPSRGLPTLITKPPPPFDDRACSWSTFAPPKLFM